jgi:hypothetical protein
MAKNTTESELKYALLTILIAAVLFAIPYIGWGKEVHECDGIFWWYIPIRGLVLFCLLYACYCVIAGRDDDDANPWRYRCVAIAVVYLIVTTWPAAQYRQDKIDNIAPVSRNDLSPEDSAAVELSNQTTIQLMQLQTNTTIQIQ